MNVHEGNSEKFLTTYNELDKYMRKYLNEDKNTPHSHLIHYMTRKNKLFKEYEYELKSYADLRNVIIHNPEKGANPIAEPHDNIVARYEEIKNKIMNSPLALNTVAITNIYTASLTTSVREVIRVMYSKTYTHVPVIDDGRMIGVFSENTILSYITSREDTIIDKNTLIEEFAEFLPIEKHSGECFEFVNKKATVNDIEEIFHNDFKIKKRAAVVFITETGNINEKLSGIITAWDIAGYTD